MSLSVATAAPSGRFPASRKKPSVIAQTYFISVSVKKIISGNVNFDEAALYIMDEEGKATGGTFGNSENMVNAGVSFTLDKNRGLGGAEVRRPWRRR